MSEFDCLWPGRGHTVDFIARGITNIGTIDCSTGVGVYFRIDDKQAFVAHIDGTSRTTWPHHFLLLEKAQEMMEVVLTALINESAEKKWSYEHPDFVKHL